MNTGIATMGSPAIGSSTMRSSRRSAHRFAALARAEGVLLRRNRIALLNALALPAVLVFALKSAPSVADAGGSSAVGAILLTGLMAFALLSGVYYNLVTALVARREQLVLKRSRTGESTDAEILAGTAAPAIAIAWAQTAAGTAAAVAVFGMAPPANAVLALVALILGTAVFALLAAVSTVVTRTAELAQVTTLPVLMIPFALSGLLFPLATLPEPLRSVAGALPLTPVVELMRLGLTGTAANGHHLGLAATFGAAAIPVLVLAAWIAAGTWAVRRWFRWEPRR
jgi:ABC-2 type transport system permease protein